MEIPLELVPWLLGVLGAFVGSFLNVCIHRMPEHRSIVYPGSACPACGAPIRPWQNIPVLSWILLRGRCASCRAPISVRYPFVEALTSALFVLCWHRFGPGWELAAGLVFLPAMVVLFFTDLDERILPDLVTLPGATVGLLFAFFRAAPHPFAQEGSVRAGLVGMALAAAAGAGAAGALWLLGWLWRFVRPGIDSAMGLGDVKMLAMVGAFLGARLTLLTVFLGSLLGTGIYLFARLLAWLLPGEEAPAGSDGGGITPGEGVHAAEAAPDASPASVPEQPPAQTIVRGRGSSSPLRALRRGLEAAGFLVEGRGAGMLDQIPFGSLLAVAAAIALLGGERLLAGYSAFSLSFGEWVFRLFSGGA